MSKNFLCPGFWDGDNYKIIDQTLLPESTLYCKFETCEEVAEAIKFMRLRGAPLIGAAASSGLALSVKKSSFSNLKENFEKAAELLASTRPTAVNLFTVIKETATLFYDNYKKNLTPEKMFRKLKNFSISIHERDIKRNHKMGKYGAEYTGRIFGEKKLSVITHCNAGALATCGYGTALGVIRALHEKNKIKMVWVDETRPLLQGSRLTAYELEKEDIPFTVITDSAASHVMYEKRADFIITGADRVAANG
ncbi:MAG: S-methyl-5-thioribose-1-phosphate isomerase, partial [bacterium]